MPTISAATVRCCADTYRRAPGRIVIATYQGRRGHPIIFPMAVQCELGELGGGLNELPRRYGDRVTELAVDDANILRDIDTADDFNRFMTPDR
jgi:molybdenum cofactor cytidylyltransferase